MAVDIWALGQIVFRMMTGKLAFSGNETGELLNYIREIEGFPRSPLLHLGTSSACCDFIEKAMAAIPGERPKATELLKHEWIEVMDVSSTFNTEEARQ